MRLGEPNQDEAPNGDESGPKDAVWVGGAVRPRVKRGKVRFGRASSEEKRHFPALRGGPAKPVRVRRERSEPETRESANFRPSGKGKGKPP